MFPIHNSSLRINAKRLAIGCFALPFLAGCAALGTSTEPSTATGSGNGSVSQAPTNVSSSPSGFSVQPETSASLGFPTGTIDASGTVGRYQVGPRYNLNGAVITPVENLEYSQRGVAGWYGDGFEGATTANGEVLKSDLRTFAHRTLPFGTIARITNVTNGRNVIARVNDRGPIQPDRLIDVTTRIAQELGFNEAGRANVQVQVLEVETRRVASLTGGQIGVSSASLPVAYASGGGSTINTAALAPAPVTSAFPSSTSSVTSTTTTTTTLAPLAPPTPISGAGSASASVFASPSSATAGGLVYVQAGTFCDRANALRLEGTLQSIGAVLVEPVNLGGQQCLRVRVGPYGSESEARIVLGRVVAAGATDAIIRRVN